MREIQPGRSLTLSIRFDVADLNGERPPAESHGRALEGINDRLESDLLDERDEARV